MTGVRKTLVALTYHGKPAKIEKSTFNSRMYVLWIKNNGGWVREDVSNSRRHLIGHCKFSQ